MQTFLVNVIFDNQLKYALANFWNFMALCKALRNFKSVAYQKHISPRPDSSVRPCG